MSKKWLAIMAFAAASITIFSGCGDSDAMVQSELAVARREAYLEWKRQRDSGATREARADGPLSVNDAVRMALQFNKQLQIAIEQREVTRGSRIADYSVILPNFTARGSAARIEKGRGNTDIDSYSFGVTVTQPIFEGEYIPATLRTAKLLTALTDEQVREAVQNLIANVATTYYDILLSQHMVEVQREALVSAQAQYRMTSEKKRQETATDYDVLRAQVDVANYQSQMILAQNDIDTNRVNLFKYMGISQDSNVTFSDKLEFLPMRPVFERAVELASGNRPDLRIADLDARRAEEAVRIARSAFWPQVSGYYSTNWSDGWGATRGRDSFGRHPWEAGVNLNYYFGIDNVGNLHSAQAQARQEHIRVLDYQEQTLQEIRLQMNNLNNAEEQVKALVINQDAAREALRLVEVGYQAGVRTEVDVTDARSALTDVMGQYWTALNQHTKARVNLQLAMGVLGPTCVDDGPIIPPNVPIANIEEFAATDYVPPAPIPIPTSDRPSPSARERRERSRRDATNEQNEQRNGVDTRDNTRETPTESGSSSRTRSRGAGDLSGTRTSAVRSAPDAPVSGSSFVNESVINPGPMEIPSPMLAAVPSHLSAPANDMAFMPPPPASVAPQASEPSLTEMIDAWVRPSSAVPEAADPIHAPVPTSETPLTPEPKPELLHSIIPAPVPPAEPMALPVAPTSSEPSGAMPAVVSAAPADSDILALPSAATGELRPPALVADAPPAGRSVESSGAHLPVPPSPETVKAAAPPAPRRPAFRVTVRGSRAASPETATASK